MKSKKDTDLIFWAKLKDGDIEALGGLYDLYIDELFRYGMQYAADKAEVFGEIM